MSIVFLGQVVSKEGIATDPAKVEKICNLSAPKDNSGIISILALLQVVHQELLHNNSPSTGIVEEICPLQVGR